MTILGSRTNVKSRVEFVRSTVMELSRKMMGILEILEIMVPKAIVQILLVEARARETGIVMINIEDVRKLLNYVTKTISRIHARKLVDYVQEILLWNLLIVMMQLVTVMIGYLLINAFKRKTT